MVLACGHCGHGYTTPVPENLDVLYASEYYEERYNEKPGPIADIIKHERSRVALLASLPKGASVLDVGCGIGKFLLAAKHAGFKPTGHDIVSNHAAQIRRSGLDMIVGEFSADAIPGHFDCITMFHTLEHHPNPLLSLYNAWQLLNPGGLLIIEVPNHESTDAHIEGLSWPGWEIPFHLHHFTRRSLNAILSRFSFTPLQWKTFHSNQVKGRLRKTVVLYPLARMIASFYTGTGILVVAQKSGLPDA